MQHLILARGAGIGETQLREIEQGPDAPGWSADDAAVLRAVDELHAQACVSDATWAQLRERFETPQLMDLLFLAGGYTTLAFALNSIGLPLEASAEPADPDVRRRSEELTSELQSLMRTSYAVFCLKKKKNKQNKI